MKLWSRFFPEGWNSTIRTKLTAIFTLLIAVISVFIFIFFPARLKNQATEAVVAKAQTIAEMTAYSISPALFFEDIENIEKVFKSTRQNKDLVYIMLLNDSGETVTVFNKDKADKANFIQAKNNNYMSRDGMTYNIMTPILHNTREIGQLYLGLSLKELKAEISRSRAIIALVSVMIFIVGMVAVFGISTLVTGPLSQMAKTVEQISQGDLTQRAAVSSQDEVGQLAQSFNLMVDSLESAHRELKDLNASLEKRVTDRTKELQQEIDERRRAEEALRKSEEKYRNIFENIAEGIYQSTPEGKILLVNPAIVKMLGYDSANELMQINVEAGYQSPADRRKFEELMEKYGQVKGLEANWKKKDGTTLIVREKAHVVRDDEGEILYYEGTIEDITER
ncbi:MAG: PAS domain S-box protein, partial [Candidatus Latescibacteria bacterium]|nr:PAS domain S-box protein [Candidatus Latescibacterota bacterium]